MFQDYTTCTCTYNFHCRHAFSFAVLCRCCRRSQDVLLLFRCFTFFFCTFSLHRVRCKYTAHIHHTQAHQPCIRSENCMRIIVVLPPFAALAAPLQVFIRKYLHSKHKLISLTESHQLALHLLFFLCSLLVQCCLCIKSCSTPHSARMAKKYNA